jgi:hypothetical protein
LVSTSFTMTSPAGQIVFFSPQMGHVWDIHGTCMGHLWDIYTTFKNHLWDMKWYTYIHKLPILI